MMNNIKSTRFIIYTDGGCAKNPGGKGGYGVVVRDTASNKVYEISEGYQATTNNRMEMMALLAALREIPEGETADIYSDSQYAIKCFTKEWQRKKNLDLWPLLDEAAANKMIFMHWVKGHDKCDENNRCDELATKAMRKAVLMKDEGYHNEK